MTKQDDKRLLIFLRSDPLDQSDPVRLLRINYRQGANTVAVVRRM